MSINLIPPVFAQQTPLKPIDCYGAFCPAGNSLASATSQTESLITMVIGFLTIVAGLAFLIYFMIGGLQWLTAGGDKGKVETARIMMTNGAIGMIIVVASYGIIWIVGQLLGINILNPASVINSILPQGSGGNSPTGVPIPPGTKLI